MKHLCVEVTKNQNHGGFFSEPRLCENLRFCKKEQKLSLFA